MALNFQFRVGDQPIRDYTITANERLGGGAFGTVWPATTAGDVSVAIKFIDVQSNPAKGTRELQSLGYFKNLNHTGLAKIYSIWEFDEQGIAHPLREVSAEADTTLLPSGFAVVMERGVCTLEDRLAERRSAGEQGLPPNELLRFMQNLAEGLDYLHQPHVGDDGRRCALIHRDVKPANIIVTGNGKDFETAKLCDYGIASVMPEGDTSKETACMFSFPFLAPEVAEGTVHAHTDQYSLAVTYYYLRYGKKVVPGSLDFVDRREQAVLRKATARDPHHRYASCRDFVAALREANTPKRSQTIRRLAIAACLLGTSSLGAATWMALFQPDRAMPTSGSHPANYFCYAPTGGGGACLLNGSVSALTVTEDGPEISKSVIVVPECQDDHIGRHIGRWAMSDHGTHLVVHPNPYAHNLEIVDLSKSKRHTGPQITGRVQNMAISRDGEQVAAHIVLNDDDRPVGHMQLWKWQNQRWQLTADYVDPNLTTRSDYLGFVGPGQRLVSSSIDRPVLVWPHDSAADGTGATPMGNTCLAATAAETEVFFLEQEAGNSRLHVIDNLEGGTIRSRQAPYSVKLLRGVELRASWRGSAVAVCGQDDSSQEYQIWVYGNFKAEPYLLRHAQRVAFDREGHIAAIGFQDGGVTIADLARSTELTESRRAFDPCPTVPEGLDVGLSADGTSVLRWMKKPTAGIDWKKL